MRLIEVINSNMVIKEGDTKEIFNLGLSYVNGEKPDLTDATVQIFIANEEGVVVTKQMDIVGEGIVSFELTDSDVTGNGSFDAEVIVLYSDGKRETFPDTNYLSMKVMPSLEKRGEITYVDHYELIVTRVTQLKQEIEDLVEQAKVDIGSGTHSHNIEDLSNVKITNATSGQLLSFNGTNWINIDSSAGEVSTLEDAETIWNEA